MLLVAFFIPPHCARVALSPDLFVPSLQAWFNLPGQGDKFDMSAVLGTPPNLSARLYTILTWFFKSIAIIDFSRLCTDGYHVFAGGDNVKTAHGLPGRA